MQHRAALDAVLAGVEVEAAVHDLIGNACEIAWSERVDALRECVRVCAARAAALEAEREAERVLQLRRAFEAEELKQKFELELWELAKQLQESKR